MSVPAQAISAVLGGQKSLRRRVVTLRQLEQAVADGLPKAALDTLVAGLVTPGGEHAANDLRFQIVPRATYRRAERFNLQTSETIERIARLYAMALDAFADPVAATRFMMNSHPELDGRRPFDAALTEPGGRAVETVIERGLHGLPA